MPLLFPLFNEQGMLRPNVVAQRHDVQNLSPEKNLCHLPLTMTKMSRSPLIDACTMPTYMGWYPLSCQTSRSMDLKMLTIGPLLSESLHTKHSSWPQQNRTTKLSSNSLLGFLPTSFRRSLVVLPSMRVCPTIQSCDIATKHLILLSTISGETNRLLQKVLCLILLPLTVVRPGPNSLLAQNPSYWMRMA